MPQGRSGVLRTFVCECRPKATPKAALQQLKKNAHGSDQKQNRLEKYSLVVLLLPTAILAGTHPIFFSTASVPLLSCPLYGTRPIFLFGSRSALPMKADGLDTSKSACTGLWPPFYFAGGKRWRPCPFFVRAFFLAGSPRTPVRLLGRALAHE
jgi:hypothetical protein